MSILDWIDVGLLSAERDPHLTDYFYDNGTLSAVISNPNAFLVLGRKGAGKTALFSYLTKNPSEFLSPSDFITSLSMDDYSWNVHALLEQSKTAESLAFRLSWKFLLLVEVTRVCSAQMKNPGKAIIKANRLLEKVFGSPIPSTFELVGKKLLSLSKIVLPKGGAELDEGSMDTLKLEGGEVAFEEFQTSSDLRSKLTNNIEGLTNYIEEALLSEIPFTERVFIVFDRIDEAWDKTSAETSRKVITGLISAADTISQKFQGSVRPIVFIREDIFETLPLNDKNKLREDCGKLLKWDRENLVKMILKRINYFAELAKQPTISDPDLLFDKEEMRQRSRPFTYILKRTMMRPRDLICFFTKLIDTMKDEIADPFAEKIPVFEKLSTESIYQAEVQYSEWLVAEIREEWEVQHEMINLLLETIQNLGSTNLDPNNYMTALSKRLLDLDKSNFTDHLRFLFLNSIIGFKIGASTTWRFKCVYNTQGFVESPEYHIHDGLTRALNLKEPRESSA